MSSSGSSPGSKLDGASACERPSPAEHSESQQQFSQAKNISSVYVVLSFESSSCGELLKWTGSTSAPAAPLGAVPSDAAGSAPAAAAARTHVADTFGASRAGPMKHDGSRRGSPAPAYNQERQP